MKKISIIIISLILAFVTCLSASAIDFDDLPEMRTQVVYAASMDNDQVIYEKNADLHVAPAGLLTVAAALVIIEKNPNLDKTVTVPSDVESALSGTGASLLNLDPGEQFTVRELLHFILIRSAADVSYTLAVASCGTAEKFVEEMNALVTELGCTDTHFTNVTGLDDDQQYTTARDMWTIAKAASLNATYTEIASVTEFSVEKTDTHSKYSAETSCLLLDDAYGNYYSSTVKWGKSGSTKNAGHCVVAQASRDGYTFIYVFMNAPYEKPEEDSDFKRDYAFYDCHSLIVWSFKNIKLQVLCDTNEMVTTVPLKFSSKSDHVTLYPAEQIKLLLPSSVTKDSVLLVVDEDETKSRVYAPVKKGTVVGRANIVYSKEVIATVDLVVGETAMFSFTGFFQTIGRILLPILIVLCVFALIFIIIHTLFGVRIYRDTPHFRVDSVTSNYYKTKLTHFIEGITEPFSVDKNPRVQTPKSPKKPPKKRYSTRIVQKNTHTTDKKRKPEARSETNTQMRQRRPKAQSTRKVVSNRNTTPDIPDLFDLYDANGLKGKYDFDMFE